MAPVTIGRIDLARQRACALRNPVRISDHDRLQRPVVEVDADAVGHLAIETRVTAITHSSDRDGLERTQSLPAHAALAVLAHVCFLARRCIR
jgi:hypothetical protein